MAICAARTAPRSWARHSAPRSASTRTASPFSSANGPTTRRRRRTGRCRSSSRLASSRPPTRRRRIGSRVSSRRSHGSEAGRPRTGARARRARAALPRLRRGRRALPRPTTLPATDADPPASFADWERLALAARWRLDLLDLEPGLFDLLLTAASYVLATGNADATKKAIVESVSAFTGWQLAELEALLGKRGTASDRGLLGLGLPTAASPTNDLADIATWIRVRDCMEAAATTGASCTACAGWTGPTVTLEAPRSVQQAAKAKSARSSGSTSSRRCGTRSVNAAGPRSSPTSPRTRPPASRGATQNDLLRPLPHRRRDGARA